MDTSFNLRESMLILEARTSIHTTELVQLITPSCVATRPTEREAIKPYSYIEIICNAARQIAEAFVAFEQLCQTRLDTIATNSMFEVSQ